MRLPSSQTLQQVYGDGIISLMRFEALAKNYEKSYGNNKVEFFTAPGRTEVIGNHTDHNGGKVIAGSITMDTIGAAYPNGCNTIEIISEGYAGKIVVDVTAVDSIPINQGTVSLVAGMVKAVQEFGYKVSGFSAYISTQVISSAGVSSSASFEMLICSMINYFFNDNKLSYTQYAKIGQFAENKFWSKASGLMDQMACAVGGAILLHFENELNYEKIDLDFEKFGYDIVIVNTGKGHADLSHEYSEIPQEMKTVASKLGVSQLSETSLEDLLSKINEVKNDVANDRAIMRAIHFFEETKRVELAAKAIEEKNGTELFRLIRESGRSSWELLQNCYAIANYKEQKVALSLALTELFINEKKDGFCRVHGGGFAGVIMGIIPTAYVKEYVGYMAEYVGKDNVYPMNIRQVGAVHLSI